MNETIFRLIAAAIVIVAISISLYHRLKAHKAGGSVSRKEEGMPILILLRLAGLAAWLSLLAYLINPRWLDWAVLPLPAWARWFGVGLGITALPLLYWLFSSIGLNITDTVTTRKSHTLVTHGPYRWVRHPLYTVGATLFISMGLLASNWFIIITSLVALGLLMLRLPKEEAMLLKAFGDEYREYMKRTGALLPRLKS